MTHFMDTVFQWTDEPVESNSELMRAAQTGVELDANSARCHWSLGLAHMLAGDLEGMAAELERAIELDPSLAMAHAWLAGALARQGRLEEARASAEKAIRLSPRDAMLWYSFFSLAVVHFYAHRYEDAADWARRSIRANPRFPFSRAYLAAACAHLGRSEEARSAVQELLEVQPGFSVAFARSTGLASDPDYVDGLRKAGLPEE
jgi:tetratricopeptide (TPR) repeat protein